MNRHGHKTDTRTVNVPIVPLLTCVNGTVSVAFPYHTLVTRAWATLTTRLDSVQIGIPA